MQILRPGVVRTKMSQGSRRSRRSRRRANEVAENVMRALATDSLVIWSPPILRYVAFLIRHLPRGMWRRIAEREK